MKKFISMMLIGLIVMTSLSFGEAIEGTLSTAKLLLNGQEIEEAIVIYNQQSYLPVRVLAEQLGLTVGWNSSENAITLDAPVRTADASFEQEMLALMEEESKKLEEENNVLKELLRKNNIQVPTVDKVVQLLNTQSYKYLSVEGSKYLEIRTGYDVTDSKYGDVLGNKFSNYIVLHVWGSSGSDNTKAVSYAASGQYDKFQATLSPYNEEKDSFKRDMVVLVDGKEVYRKTVTEKSLPEDISVDIKGGKIITIKCDVKGRSMGGFVLGDPRFTTN